MAPGTYGTRRRWRLPAAAAAVTLALAGAAYLWQPEHRPEQDWMAASGHLEQATETGAALARPPGAPAVSMAQPQLASPGAPSTAGLRTAGLRTLSGQQFSDLFYQVDLPDLSPVTSSPHITGDDPADAQIVSIAEGRGYRLQAEATGSMSSVDGQQLQPAAAQAWRELAVAAAEDGIWLEVISGFRSVADQRQIFLNRLAAQGQYTDAQIVAGEADGAIDAVLQTSSIPGYSKHHTGYAVDVRDAGSGSEFTGFAETAGYEWMSADNFANAKRFGFVPSYPHGVEQQGPIPEEWEFVWVGVAPLRA